MQIGSMPSSVSPGFADIASSRSGLAKEQAEFARIMSMASAGKTPAPREADDEARDAAEQLVAVVLIEPIFKRMRESNQAAPPFAPTNGEKQFQSMLDAKLAHEITSAARFPLVDRLARDLRSTQRTEAQ
ncbi:hypothetical protein MNBD_PLANCTO03-806 [hydrothermal vent metagenome]|uniref:Flagellar protein FlgJ N-terminal domain-containing protein n=1 Tax=hydrothermal vent metagenome TaxID=652676 RepID=A0A3B1DQS0_9ZZZZ